MIVGPASAPRRLVLLGHPLGHTLSPALHNAAMESAGRATRYSTAEVEPDKLDETLDTLILDDAAGNVTIPHKQAVAARCMSRTVEANRAGAVNTFWTRDGSLHGHNTDVGGFDVSARALLDERNEGQRVAIIGSGGAAAGVLTAIERWPSADVRVWSRTPARAHQLAARFENVACVLSLGAAIAGATLLVNATPLGLRASDAFPVDVAAIDRQTAVLDLVYRRGETSWVHAARAKGLRASDGLPMLVEQAALAQETWFGDTADRDAMWAAVGGRPAWLTAKH